MGVLNNSLVGRDKNAENQKVTTSQDDGLVGVLKNLLVECVKTTKIKKVTTSRDSAWLGNCGAGAADFK